MTDRRVIGFVAVPILTITASLLPDAWFSPWLRYLASAYISIDLIFRARAGYLRRRSFWTTDSWRRYLAACAVPVAAIGIMLAMMVALESGLSIVGEARTGLRAVWAVGTVVFMLIGVIGIVITVEWLHRGEASAQFALPPWLSKRRHEAA